MSGKNKFSEWFKQSGKAIGAVLLELLICILIYIVCNAMFGPVGTTIALAIMFIRIITMTSKL